MSYSPKPGLPSSYSTRSTPSASLAARSATPVAAGPTGRFEGRGHRPDRVGPAGFPVHASEGPQRTAPFVFCQIEVVQNGVSIQSEKAAGFSPVERKDPPPLLFGFYPIRAWVRLYDSPSNLIILP